jgi:hypothetical protein
MHEGVAAGAGDAEGPSPDRIHALPAPVDGRDAGARDTHYGALRTEGDH